MAEGVGLPESLAAGVTANVKLTEMASLEVVFVVHSLVAQSITQLTQHCSSRCTDHHITAIINTLTTVRHLVARITVAGTQCVLPM